MLLYMNFQQSRCDWMEHNILILLGNTYFVKLVNSFYAFMDYGC